jgi:hypothetical protein
MFSTCVARGIAAKLVYKTVGGKVETSLFCSTAAATPAAATPAAAAASISQKKGRKRPDNERRKMRREAWQQRRCVLQPGIVRAASSRAAAVSEEDLSPVARSAAAASSTPEPAAPGTVSTAPATATAATTPPHAWAWENRDGLLVTARRIPKDLSESPETARDSEVGGDLNLSASSWTQDREDDCIGRESPPTAAKTATAPAAAVPGPVALEETSPTAEEGVQKGVHCVQPAFQPPPPPPPWSKYFSCHYRRVLCTVCFAGNREIWNAKCSDCYRLEREKFKKLKDSQRK